jgi:excisionase family DNA binding protein
MKDTPKPRLYSIKDFIRDYGISRASLYEEIKHGRIRARKFGKKTLIAREDAEAWFSRLPDLKPAHRAAA